MSVIINEIILELKYENEDGPTNFTQLMNKIPNLFNINYL